MPVLYYKESKIPGLKLIVPDVFEDYRGSYTETYDSEKWKDIIGDIVFVADGVSTSRKNVLRGIHGDDVTIKLVTAMYGAYYSVIEIGRAHV